MTSRTTTTQYRCKRSQKGEAELMAFGLVVLLAALVSGTLYVLHWVKDNKYAERRARHLAELEAKKSGKYSGRRDPAEFLVHCDKPAWALLKTKYNCSVMPQSYSELFFMP